LGERQESRKKGEREGKERKTGGKHNPDVSLILFLFTFYHFLFAYLFACFGASDWIQNFTYIKSALYYQS
jgi:hypothetical protein